MVLPRKRLHTPEPSHISRPEFDSLCYLDQKTNSYHIAGDTICRCTRDASIAYNWCFEI